jgi:Transglycosylase-like domain
MTTLLVGAVLMLGGFPQPDLKDEGYKPIHKGCRTKACDDRVSARERKKMRAHRRRVQARHKATVRAERHAAKMLRVVRPHRGWLASTRSCESGGNYSINTGNGFYGAYQFTLQSWRAVGGWGMPHLASKMEQDYRAVLLLNIQGRGAWPVCG